MSTGTQVTAVLAAGAGSRFGGAKLLEPLAGRPLIQWPLQAALAAGPGRVLLVLGFHEHELREKIPPHPRLELIHNPSPQEGMAGSLVLAARRAREMGADMLVLLLGDMPLVDAGLISRVARAARQGPAGAAAARAQGRPGHPVALDSRYFSRLTGLEGDQGARGILAGLGDALALVPADPATQWDVDTPQDLERLRRHLQTKPA